GRPARRGGARGWRCAACPRSPAGRPWRASCPGPAELVEESGDGAGVAAALRSLPLELVDLLDGEDGDDEIVVLELEDGVRVVEQDVRVEDVVFLHGSAGRGTGATGVAAGPRGVNRPG